VPAPLVKEDWLFVCTGFNKAQLYAFQSTSHDKPPRLMWKLTRSAPLVPSPVLVDEHIYMVADNGVASCVEARTGRLIWNERIGGTYWASVLSSPGRVYFVAENGSTTILAASPQFRVLAKNQLNGEIMATPAITDNALFVRTRTHLYRLQMNRRQDRHNFDPSSSTWLTNAPVRP
jgi:outer membrane protein assembly factor BamB